MKSKRTANLLGAAAQLIVDAQLNAIETSAELNPTELAALITVLNAPGQQIDFLHKTLRRSHSATVRLVAKLASLGLVTKVSGEQDGRGVTLTVTARGQKLVSKALASRQKALDGYLSFLSEEEKDLLDSLMAKLLASTVVDELNAYQICRFCDGDACDVCPVEETFLA